MGDFMAETRDLLERTPNVFRALLTGLPEDAGIAGSHDAEVGPWTTYLGILLRRDDPAAVPE